MPREPSAHQNALKMVMPELLVPADNLLCQTDAFIDFEYVRNQFRSLHCIGNGRPVTDPVVLFKLGPFRADGLQVISIRCVRTDGLIRRSCPGELPVSGTGDAQD